MNSTKMLTTIILICLMVFGGFSLLMGNSEGKQEYETAVKQAEDYMERGLYQLAIEEYEKAIALKDSETLRDAVLAACEKRYEETEAELEQYISAAESAVSAYPENENYYLILADVLTRGDDYQAAYRALEDAKENGVDAENIRELYRQVKYAFETNWYTYMDFLPCTEGLYPVKSAEGWGYVNETGESETGYEYAFASQLGEEGIRILAGEETLLIDENDVVRGKLSFVPVQAGRYAEGLIAIDNGNSVGYYNALGDYQFGEYTAASNFQNGKAAVASGEGVWSFVDSEGETVSDQTYEDIRLNPDGSYLTEGIMLAKTDGAYRLYDEEGSQIGTFSCDDVDVVTEDKLIAFASGEQWGFVKGEVVIEPAFDGAKSFSNGLAAVCIDGKWGYVDETGEIVIDCQFFDADYFNGARSCLVKTTSKEWQMITLKVSF